MIRLTVSKNSRGIGDIAIHNTGEFDPDDETYRYEVFDLRDDIDAVTIYDYPMLAFLHHHRPDGVAELICHTMTVIEEQEAFESR